MQILMSVAALARVSERCKEIAPAAELTALEAGSAFEPELVWLSRDLHGTPQLKAMTDLILQTPSVRWVQTYQAGIDNPVYRQMMERGVRVTRSDAQAAAIADYVVSHALSLLHPIAEQERLQRAHVWQRTPFREIGSLHFVLVGFGAIGREVAKRLAPFDPAITVVRGAPRTGEAYQEISLGNLETVLPSADVVILACALNEQTRGFANQRFFTALRPGAILINVARGALVDEQALQTGLARGQPAFAVLDVFQQEPLAGESWLWDHPQVRVTAHTANDSDAVSRRGDELFLDNLGRYLAGADLRNEARL